ncbi:MAG: L-fuculose-phosphate aldolase [Candidatus Marinimicrobia bacterium]|nr:L-fuculose-phosphate aldolase [Candidatus Neomarinimicrobiota bacterium]MBL7010965.1 L-fuculose-phosphate aldolase [Candidatus Neomarinimicrobiota bacterium]MBL7031390.1 L-fuculose-phosphate aldolase [Candidatus Neomarinimicrobiota bacterium]
MLLKIERESLIDWYQKMFDTGLTNGTSGNVSIFNRKEALVAMSPTGVGIDRLTPEDISIVELDGTLVEGLKPSSEVEMHNILYRNREDINAIVHGHTIYATTVACLREDLPAIDYMIAVAGGNNVRCAEYATYGTRELAENALQAMEGRKAVLLANHGLITGAENIQNAFHIAEQIEYISKLYVKAKSMGEPVILSDDEMEKMVKLFKNYGQIKN